MFVRGSGEKLALKLIGEKLLGGRPKKFSGNALKSNRLALGSL